MCNQHQKRVLYFSLFIILIATKASAVEHEKNALPFWKIMRQEHIEGISMWDIDEADFICIVSDNPEDIEPSPKIRCFEEIQNAPILRYEQKSPMTHLETMFQLRSNQHLVTYWARSQDFLVRIFSYVDHQVHVTFERGSECMPEIVDVDNDGFLEIILCNGAFLMNKQDNYILESPESASIYRWDGQQYTLLKTVSWKNRFCDWSLKNTNSELKE